MLGYIKLSVSVCFGFGIFVCLNVYWFRKNKKIRKVYQMYLMIDGRLVAKLLAYFTEIYSIMNKCLEAKDE